MDNKKRMRKPVVCNVCRRRKIRCDKAKPACTACKKANMSHVCSYDERPAFSHLELEPPVHQARTLTLHQNHQNSQQNGHRDQHLLQQQHAQFQQQLHQRQHAQFQFQGQVAARYGQSGQPLTGASASQQRETIYAHQVPVSVMPTPPPPLPHHPYPSFVHASLPSLNPSLALSDPQPQLQPQPTQQWAMVPPPMSGFIPQSYNTQQNLQSELDVLSKRMVQVQGAMRQQGVQPMPAQMENGNSVPNSSTSSGSSIPPLQSRSSLPHLHPQSHTPQSSIPVSMPRLPSLKSDDYIDPTLFDADEIMRSHKFNIPESKYFKFQSTGLFEASSFIKKDSYQALYHFNILEYGKDKPENLTKKHSGHFNKMIDNPHYALEDYMKYEKGNLAELVKQIERKLPTKKVTWILLDLYHDIIGANIVPIFDKKEFQDMLSLIIGKREETDSRTKLYMRVEDNSYIVTLVFLLLALRLAQFTLICIRNPTEYQNNLLKASCASIDYDRYITILSSVVDNLADMNTISHFKLESIRTHYGKVNFDGLSQRTDDTPTSLATLAMSANFNNLSVTGDDAKLKQLWSHVYFCYYHSSAHRGLPILLTEDYFYLDLKEKSMNPITEVIPRVNEEELEIFNSVERILNKLNVFSSVLTLSALDELLKNYDDNLIKLQGKWNDFKVQKLPMYQKIMYTLNNFTHKQTKISVISLVLLHCEVTGTKVNGPRYKAYLHELCNLYVEAFDEMGDAYQNYSHYFPSGYEFMVNVSFLPQMERLLGHLASFIHRSIYHKKPLVSLLKFYLNVINDEHMNDLAQYFSVWRCKNRLKLVVHLWKKHAKGEIDLYKTTFEYEGETIDFKSIPAQYETFDDHTWAMLDKNFDRLNERYTSTKYHSMTTVDGLLDSIDFEAPHFNTRYFYFG